MTICLVTDRRRADPVVQVAKAITAGIELIQVRERDLDAAALATLVRRLLAVTHGSTTRLLVNDRLDVALACGADGVHLRADSMVVADVRRVAPAGFLIGRSVHAPDEARTSGAGADYLVAGTVFRTASKADTAPLLGPDGLRAIVAATAVPVLAIGGISPDNVGAIARTGAAGVAAIGSFASVGSVASVVAALRMRFDSAKTAP